MMALPTALSCTCGTPPAVRLPLCSRSTSLPVGLLGCCASSLLCCKQPLRTLQWRLQHVLVVLWPGTAYYCVCARQLLASVHKCVACLLKPGWFRCGSCVMAACIGGPPSCKQPYACMHALPVRLRCVSAWPQIFKRCFCVSFAENGDASGSRFIVAMAFSPCGQRLVVVTGDNRHTVSVFAWRTKQLLHQGVGHNGQPPQVSWIARRIYP